MWSGRGGGGATWSSSSTSSADVRIESSVLCSSSFATYLQAPTITVAKSDCANAATVCECGHAGVWGLASYCRYVRPWVVMPVLALLVSHLQVAAHRHSARAQPLDTNIKSHACMHARTHTRACTHTRTLGGCVGAAEKCGLQCVELRACSISQPRVRAGYRSECARCMLTRPSRLHSERDE